MLILTYLDKNRRGEQTKGRHVETDRHVPVCGGQQVEEERLVEPLQQVVEATTHAFHYSERLSNKGIE